MDGANSPVVEVHEGDETLQNNAITLYEESREVSQYNKTLKNSQANPEFTSDEIQEIIDENQRLKDNESKYQDHINNLKSKLKLQKNKTIAANSEKVKYFAHRNDLEDFFLNCIEEVKKDISKRKIQADGYAKKLNKSSSEVFDKRAKTAKSKAPKLDAFTKTDKKKVIELLISNDQVLLYLYEKLFPYQNQRPQSVRTFGDQKMRPTSSQPSLTTAQSYIPSYLLNNQPSSRFAMEDGTSIGSPSKVDQRFLPNQSARAKTAQGSNRAGIKTLNQFKTPSGSNLFKIPQNPFENDQTTNSLLGQNNPQNVNYSNYYLKRMQLGTPSEDMRRVDLGTNPLHPGYPQQTNINNLNVNINLEAPQQISHFVPPKASNMMKRTGTAPGVPRSVSMKQFRQLKTAKSKKRLKIIPKYH